MGCYSLVANKSFGERETMNEEDIYVSWDFNFVFFNKGKQKVKVKAF